MPDAFVNDMNMRAARYFLAQTSAACPRCANLTRLVAVGLLPGHEVLELNDDAQGDDAQHPAAGDAWAAAHQAAFLFDIAELSENVAALLAETAPAYCFDAAAGEGCWANHCEHCGAPFEDQELFSEPGGAFLPAGEADARLIRLFVIDEALAADAAGYAHEPEFFHAMSRD